MNIINIGQIGVGEDPYTAADFEAQLAAADPTQDLVLDFHSEGGSVLEGFRMHQLAQAYAGKIIGRVRCAAFSIASYLLTVCDEIEFADNGFAMIHNPWSEAEGDSAELAKHSGFLSDLQASMVTAYANRTGISEDEIAEMMAAETFIGAKDAVEMGFADRILGQTPAPRMLQPQARARRTADLPVFIAAAMYGSPASKPEPAETPKENQVPVTDTKPVAATVKAIRKRYPNASNEFIVKAMEGEMAMDDVDEYAKAMESKAMQDENTSLKDQLAKAMEENEDMRQQLGMTTNAMDPNAMDPNAMDDMDPNAMQMADMDPNAYHNPGEKLGGGANARSRVNPQAGTNRRIPGLAAVSNVGNAPTRQDPTEAWNALVESFKSKGMSPAKALLAANRKSPKLRAAHVASANAHRG